MSGRGRVGVLGGTFDPLHLGHLRAADAMADALNLDKVLFVVAASPPHKAFPAVTEARHRVAMVQAAIDAEPAFELSLVEIQRGGRSYTIDTLGELQSASPETFFWFITGTDAFVEIQTWKDWERLLRTHAFAVHERPGFALEGVRHVVPAGVRVLEEAEVDPAREDTAFSESAETGVYFVRRPMLHVSSTDIRDAVRKGRSIRYLVPNAVEVYIRKNRLYE